MGGDPQKWSSAGFELDSEYLQIGAVHLRVGGLVDEITGWSLSGLVHTDLDGLPTLLSTRPKPQMSDGAHPNGVVQIDHVVVISPQLKRSIQAFTSAGLELKRVRDEPTPAGAPRQAFFKLDGVVIEVVQEPKEILEREGDEDRPSRFWGLALKTLDLKQTVEAFGEDVSEIRDAVQEGRQIATVRRSAGLSIPVALMS